MEFQIWKIIPSLPDYEVSNFGLLRNKIYKRPISTSINEKGYIKASFKVAGKVHTKYVHRLVLEAFIGPSELECDHIDCNKSNNRLDNLRYCSRSDNLLRIRERTTNKGHSSFYGVTFGNNRYIAQLKQDGAKILQSYHETELEAAKAYNNFVTENKLNLPLNSLGSLPELVDGSDLKSVGA